MSKRAQRKLASKMCYAIFHMIVSVIIPLIDSITGGSGLIGIKDNCLAGLSKKEAEFLWNRRDEIQKQAELCRKLGRRLETVEL